MMSNYSKAPEGKDPDLWEVAQKRASFKTHLASYLIVNLFLWAIWYFNGERMSDSGIFPWPIWTTLGWGIGIAFHYISAYVFPKANSVEKEYQKLKDQQNK